MVVVVLVLLISRSCCRTLVLSCSIVLTSCVRSLRRFKACYEATVAKHGDAPAASGGGSGLVAELEKLAKLHQDDCLTAEEFADAKKMLIGGSKL